MKFASRISHTNRIIVAFTSLMHDEKLIFSGDEPIERIDDCAVDGQSAATAAGDEDGERLAMLFVLARRRTPGRTGQPVTIALGPKRAAVS